MSWLERLGMRRVDPGLFWRGATEGAATLRWLGVAGFALTVRQRTLILDPYLSRGGARATLTRPLVPDEALLARELPHADAVLVGHAHYDHSLDAPAVCRNTGATLYGSSAVANIGRAYGLPEHQLVACQGHEQLRLPGGEAVPLPSRHGRVYFNRVTLPGDIPRPPPWPPRMGDLRHGQVFTWWVDWQGLRLMHVDSADYDSALVKGRPVDVLCLCAIGRRYRPGYTEEIIQATRPRLVVACHWEGFFSPFGSAPRTLPGVALAGFVEEIRRAGASAAVLEPGGSVGLDG